MPPRITNAEFQPGDLLLWSGPDPISRAIKAFTVSPLHWFRADWQCVNHVSACCDADPARLPLVAPWEAGRIAMVEATTQCDLPNLVTGRRESGVQVHWPEDRARRFHGFVYRARLAPLWKLSANERSALAQYLFDFEGRHYDFVGALRAGAGTARAADLSAGFCSEIVAAVLCRLGRLRPSNPSAWTPAALIGELVNTGIYLPPVRLK